MERSDRVQMVIDGKAASYGAVAPAPANSGGSEQISEAQLKMERSLWWWNLSCGILHLVQAVVVLGLGVGSSAALAKFKLPLTTSFLSWDVARGYPVTELRTVATVPFVAVTSGFAWLSAIAHATVLLCYPRYIADLRKGYNLFRWYEYAVSSSWMIALIAQLFGVYDILQLITLASVNACMNLFGLLMETMNAGRDRSQLDWSPFLFGCFAGVVPWIVILVYLVAGPDVARIPSFVFAIAGVYFVCFNTFPVNMVGQYLRVGWWKDERLGWKGAGYYTGERFYQIQSLVAKSLLLWLVTGGANQPNAYTRT